MAVMEPALSNPGVERAPLDNGQPRQLDTICHGDSVALLNGWTAGWADLVFADPPFNIGYTYDVYKDKRPYQEYYAWTVAWMSACKRALKPSGSFYIAIGDDYAAEVKIIGQTLGLTLRNWIIWHYTFGQNTRAKFSRSHTHILYFVCDPKDFTFNDRQLRFPSARHTRYNDRRGHPLGRLPDDTWNEFPRVCGTFRERAGWHGCQMPEGLLARIIRASSGEGETVLDPFAGSGTTPATAAKLGRHFVGIDVSEEYVRQCRRRVQEAMAARERSLNHTAADRLNWPVLHEEALAQLYRDTRVSVDVLERTEPAMRCFLQCLKERTGKAFRAADVTAKLWAMTRQGVLPGALKSSGRKEDNAWREQGARQAGPNPA